MKCKICGKRTNTLVAMNKHYAKAHPGAKKRKQKRVKASPSASEAVGMKYCPCCGREL